MSDSEVAREAAPGRSNTRRASPSRHRRNPDLAADNWLPNAYAVGRLGGFSGTATQGIIQAGVNNVYIR